MSIKYVISELRSSGGMTRNRLSRKREHMHVQKHRGMTDNRVFWEYQQKFSNKCIIQKYAELKQGTQTANGSKKKSQGKLDNILRQMKTKTQHATRMGCSESSAKRKFIVIKDLKSTT